MRFEKLSDSPNARLPERSTKGSAGYDFFADANYTILPKSIGFIGTGVKAQIDDGYYLQLAVRSSTPFKKGLILANGIGIIDADYYNNPDNEGHIMFQVYNITDERVTIAYNEKIGQGVFLKYTTTDDDAAEGERLGGFGSTGK